jgi:hypothetical protein
MNKGGVKSKEKATEYRDQKEQSLSSSTDQNVEGQDSEQQNAPPPGARSEAAWNDLISHRIDEAIRNGAFDNLRGKGKPLAIDRNPFAREDQQMANDLLKKNNLAPHWISERTAMLDTIERFRLRFRATSERFQQAWQNAADEKKRSLLDESWQRQLDEWAVEIKELNRRITTVNLQQPIARLEIFKILLEEELTRAGMKRTLM